MPKLSLVIPVYDEEENLRLLHNRIEEALQNMDYEAIYINDGSRDRSGAVLEEIARDNPNIKVIHFVRNYGQTAALTAGIRSSTSDILITLDADLQNDPFDIPQMLDKLDDCDVVCGWRKDRKDHYFSRTLPSKAANWLISTLSNVHLHDYGCTLRVYRREFIQDIPLYGEMHRFIPIYVTWAGARILEVPVTHHPRTRGYSKYGLWRIPKVLLDLTTLKFLRDFFVTPIYFFGYVGIGIALFGLLCGGLSIYFWLTAAPVFLLTTTLILCPLSLILAILEVTLGIIAEVLIRMHFEIQNKEPYRVSQMINFEKN
ncbi:MAG: glycosyltransferase family 2 protein [Myxococcota bacterium]|nr:glycosyltransferase family 2 protein [Myxococcota bacterium]